mgnify:FL=1
MLFRSHSISSQPEDEVSSADRLDVLGSEALTFPGDCDLLTKGGCVRTSAPHSMRPVKELEKKTQVLSTR